MKKPSTLKSIMYISFVPSICIHRSIILIFIGKSMLVEFFPQKIFLTEIFDFHFRENPHFCDKFQALNNRLFSDNLFRFNLLNSKLNC